MGKSGLGLQKPHISGSLGSMIRWFLVLVVLGGSCLPAKSADRPNVLFILADDLGWMDLGCYGSTFYESPGIDLLARQGMRFTRAYTAGSVCSPTRASIMTGRYPVRTGITDYIPGFKAPGARLKTRPTRQELALEEVTIGEGMREGGYQTYYAGKWHLGSAGFQPHDQGFEVVVDDDSLGNAAKDPLVGDRLTDEALKFLEQRDSTRPFFMVLAYHEPHLPILAHPRHIAHYREKAASLSSSEPAVRPERKGLTRLQQDVPGYGCEVAVLNEAVVRLTEKLESLGLAGDTVVVFTSDNGGLSTKDKPGPTSNLPLRAGKGWLYEGGIRVPLIIRAPGLTKPGTVSDVPVMSTDYFPTFLEMAGLPLHPEWHQDGRSLVPLLRGGVLASRDLFWHYPHYHGSTWAPGSAVRRDRWKLVEFFEEGVAELYDVEADPGERRNVIQEEPGKAAELRGALEKWRQETGAFIPTRS